MKRAIAITCALLAAAPAFAGDQPVITVKPPVFGYFPTTSVPDRTYTRTDVMTPVAAGGTAGSASAQAATGQNRVGGIGLSQVEANQLYARLLAEAKARKLR